MIDESWLGLADMDGLATSLEAVDVLTGERDLLVHLVRAGLRQHDAQARFDPERAPTVRADFLHIIRAVARQPRALTALREAVETIARGQLATADVLAQCDRLIPREPVMLDEAARADLFDELNAVSTSRSVSVLFEEAVGPGPAVVAPRTLRAAIAQLERRTGATPLLRFVEHVAAYAHDEDSTTTLRKWVDEHLALLPPSRRAELAELRQRLTGGAPRPAGPPVLQIRLDPVDEDRFSVDAWLSQGPGLAGAACGPEDVVTRDQLRAWLAEVISERTGGEFAEQRGARVDFILPSHLLNEPVDQWELSYGDARHRLGADYRVVVRPDARSATGAQRLATRRRVQAAVAEKEAVEVAAWLASTRRVTADLHDGPDWAWLAITCPVMSLLEEAVVAVLDTGTPVAVWLRGEHHDERRRDVLERLSRGRPVDEFPDAVRAFRRVGWRRPVDPRRDLVLLWEDPSRPPPELTTFAAPLSRAG